MPLEQINLLVGLLQCFSQQGNVLLVFLALDHDFLDGAFLLAQDLDGFRVTSLLFIQFEFDVVDACLQFADDAFSSYDGVSFDFFETDGQVLDLDFERLLDGFDFDDTFLFFVQYFDSMFDFSLFSKRFVRITMFSKDYYYCNVIKSGEGRVLPVRVGSVHQRCEVPW